MSFKVTLNVLKYSLGSQASKDSFYLGSSCNLNPHTGDTESLDRCGQQHQYFFLHFLLESPKSQDFFKFLFFFYFFIRTDIATTRPNRPSELEANSVKTECKKVSSLYGPRVQSWGFWGGYCILEENNIQFENHMEQR